jgi:hypothetical protein
MNKVTPYQPLCKVYFEENAIPNYLTNTFADYFIPWDEALKQGTYSWNLYHWRDILKTELKKFSAHYANQLYISTIYSNELYQIELVHLIVSESTEFLINLLEEKEYDLSFSDRKIYFVRTYQALTLSMRILEGHRSASEIHLVSVLDLIISKLETIRSFVQHKSVNREGYYTEEKHNSELPIECLINKIKPCESNILAKDILAWADIPFILWEHKLPKSFSKSMYFKFLQKIFGTKISHQPYAAIGDAQLQGRYHDIINELQSIIDSYEDKFTKKQAEKRARRDKGVNEFRSGIERKTLKLSRP